MNVDLEQERLFAYLWARFDAFLADAMLADLEPLSGMTTVDATGAVEFSVLSKDRGRVTLGTIEAAELTAGVAAVDGILLGAYRDHVRDANAAALEPVAEYARGLEAKRRAPLIEKAARRDARKTRALALHAEHRSVRYIARDLGIDRRTVQRYLADAESATDRDSPP